MEIRKLACIVNIWDGVEWLKYSMKQLKEHVDVFIIVYQDVSNFGEEYNPFYEFELYDFPVIFHKFIPDFSKNGGTNELNKRNLGLEIAKANDCTHFLHIDCDELYEDFGKAKEMAFNGS